MSGKFLHLTNKIPNSPAQKRTRHQISSPSTERGARSQSPVSPRADQNPLAPPSPLRHLPSSLAHLSQCIPILKGCWRQEIMHLAGLVKIYQTNVGLRPLRNIPR